MATQLYRQPAQLNLPILAVEIEQLAETTTTVFFEQLYINTLSRTIKAICQIEIATALNKSRQEWSLLADDNMLIPVLYPDYSPVLVEVTTDEVIGYEKKMQEMPVSLLFPDQGFGQVEVEDFDRPIFKKVMMPLGISEYEMWKFLVFDNNVISLHEAISSAIRRKKGLISSELAYIQAA